LPNDADANNRATQTDLFMEFAAPSFAKGGVAQRGGKRLELRPPPNARLREGWLAPLLDKSSPSPPIPIHSKKRI